MAKKKIASVLVYDLGSASVHYLQFVSLLDKTFQVKEASSHQQVLELCQEMVEKGEKPSLFVAGISPRESINQKEFLKEVKVVKDMKKEFPDIPVIVWAHPEIWKDINWKKISFQAGADICVEKFHDNIIREILSVIKKGGK